MDAVTLFLFALLNLMNEPVQSDSTMTYLALGDSYTIGESVSEDERWPVLLAQELTELGLPFGSPQIVATTGWTTDELKEGMQAAELKDQYEMVTLLIGVNNQYRGRSVENYRADYRQMLTRAIELAGGQAEHVFVLSIPDWGAMPFGRDRNPEKVAREINAYNAAKKELTEAAQVRYFDITPISRWASEDLTLVAPDGLHPSGKMYRLWVKQIIPGIYRALSNSTE